MPRSRVAHKDERAPTEMECIILKELRIFSMCRVDYLESEAGL